MVHIYTLILLSSALWETRPDNAKSKENLIGWRSIGSQLTTVFFANTAVECGGSVCDLHVDDVYNGSLVNCTKRGLTSVNQTWFPSNTTSLLLDGNNFKLLMNDTFSNMTNLRYLSIRSSKINTIEVNALRGLVRLDILDLEGNTLPILNKTFPPLLFSHVPHLEQLYIADNTIVEGSSWLHPNKSENRFPKVIDIFDQLPMLKRLSIDALPELYVGPEFSKFKKLTWLKINCIAVHTVFNDSLMGLTNTTLKDLVITKTFDAYKPVLPTSVFQSVTQIETLYIDSFHVGNQNVLRSLWPFENRTMKEININYVSFSRYSESPPLTFKDGILTKPLLEPLSKVCLAKFVLSGSNIFAIAAGSFLKGSFKDCLRTVDFSANVLGISGWRGLLFDVHRLHALEEYTQTGQFSWYKESHTLPFSATIKHGPKNELVDKNEISVSFKNPDDLIENPKPSKYTVDGLIASGIQKIFWIRFPKSIKTIRLDLITLGPYIVSGTTWLVLDVENIQDLYATNMPHFIKTTKRLLGFESLKFLDASGSGFDVEKEFFDDFPNLEVLILSSIFPSGYFETTVSLKRILQNLTKLTYLDISRNGLNAIPQGTFSASHKLEHLSLAKNRFSTIPFDISSLANLKFLDISDNAVSFLRDNEMNDLDQQEKRIGGFTLKLTGNAILCLCSDIQFLGWLQTTHVSLDNGGNYTCTSEDGVITSTDSFSDSNVIWRRCVGRNMLLISLILAAVMAMGFLCVYLLGRFKTSILAYVLHLVAPQFRTMKREDYKFGVFVGYADDDYRFVVRHLTRFLEDELGVSTFVHQRDLTAGFTDQLFYEAIQDSWRVLLVITDNFLNHYNVASIVMKYAIHSVGPVNQRRVFVLVEETHVNNIPYYLHDVLDDSRIVPFYDLDSPLNYEQCHSIKRCVFDSAI